MMSSLKIGDACVVLINDSHQRIGLIKHIGIVDKIKAQQYIGMELIEPIPNGHDGKINGIRYFTATPGTGIIVESTNIIQRLTIAQLTMKMQQIISLCAN